MSIISKTDLDKNLREFPKPVSFRKILGPSFIILALGLGSGEVILWPYLTSNYGLGLLWGAFLGITFQYFINLEIERYALVKGESVFVGLSKIYKRAPLWFIGSTFLGFGLPGIAAAAAQVLAAIFNWPDFKWLAMALLIGVGLILSIGKTVYSMMERITKTVIFLGVPFIFGLALYLVDWSDWLMLGRGFIGQGEGYWFLPEGISLATFLAAFAYSGAGGNLNLTQSIYIKEKGYGMGKYSQKIISLFKPGAEKQEIKLGGEKFAINEISINRFHLWWKKINAEHLLIFWFTGFLAICLLMLLSYATTFHAAGTDKGISFVIHEGFNIGQGTHLGLGVLFLLVVGIMLFQTQLGVTDSTSRIMAENYALYFGRAKRSVHLAKFYASFVWAQVLFGIILFLFNIYEPKTLIVIGAVINALAMFAHIGLVHLLNRKTLPKVFQQRFWRKIIISIIFAFFGIFSTITLISEIKKYFN